MGRAVGGSGTVPCGEWPGRQTGQRGAWGGPVLWAQQRGASPHGPGRWLGGQSQAAHTRGAEGANACPPRRLPGALLAASLQTPRDIFCRTPQEGADRPREPPGPVTEHTAEGVQAPEGYNKAPSRWAWGQRPPSEQCRLPGGGGDGVMRGETHPPGASVSAVLVWTLPRGPSSATKGRISRCFNPELVSETLTSSEARINNYLQKVAQATVEGARVPKHLIKPFLP